MTDRPDPFDQSIPLEERFPPASMTMEEWEAHFADRLHPRSSAEVAAVLDELAVGPEGGHDYNTSGISMSIAAQVAFNYMAYAIGASGFQASYAALHAYGQVMSIKGPFGIIKADEYLYPQYNPEATLAGWREKWTPWLKEQAEAKLAEYEARPEGERYASPHVVDHWRELAAWEPDEEELDEG